MTYDTLDSGDLRRTDQGAFRNIPADKLDGVFFKPIFCPRRKWSAGYHCAAAVPVEQGSCWIFLIAAYLFVHLETVVIS